MFDFSNICEQTITKTHTRNLTNKPAVTCSDNATLPRPSFPTVPSVPIEAALVLLPLFPVGCLQRQQSKRLLKYGARKLSVSSGAETAPPIS